MKRLVWLSLLGAAACGVPPERQALLDSKSFVQTNLDGLVTSSTALCAAAPAPRSTGWGASTDAAALTAMRAQWKLARSHYERVEGAIAVLFPELDASTDERYDGFLEHAGDANLFDGEGVTGIHAIERVLWSDQVPAPVRQFEEGLGSRYVAAAFPENEAEARDFKEKLCARLVTDVTSMRDQFKPLALDTASAFRGVVGSMKEQLEKTTRAATGEEESRYAQYTLADMRANLEGATATFEAFRPWLQSKGRGAADDAVRAGLARVQAAYAELQGDALPAPPATWSSVSPSEADRQTPFGRLFTLLEHEMDPKRDGSLVKAMNDAADALGIPQLPES